MAEKKKSDAPIEDFARHQATALEETGKALLALIPSGVRTHGWNAVESTTKGFGVLVNAVGTEVKKTLDSIDEKPKSEK